MDGVATQMGFMGCLDGGAAYFYIFQRFFAGIGLVDKMVGCRIAGKIVVAMMVMDRMALCFEKVDFGQYKQVEILLEKRWVLNNLVWRMVVVKMVVGFYSRVAWQDNQ